MGATPGAALFGPIRFDLTPAVVSGEGAVGIEILPQADGDVFNALVSNQPFPDRDFQLGTAAIRAEAGRDIQFSSGRGTVNFSGSASAFAGLAVHSQPQALLERLNFEQGAALGLQFPAGPQRYLMLTWGYDVRGAAKGSVALGVGGAVKFGAEASREALFAVVRRMEPAAPSHQTLQSVVASWRMPRQVDSLNDLAPGTWLISEVDGAIGLKLGAQFGYDFNWVREIKAAGLSGDIGLKVQLGAQVALGFHASGNYAVVVSRESLDTADQTVRLRLFKLQKKGWDFAFNAGATVTTSESFLPAGPDDFIAAVFGVHGAQIVKVVQTIEDWADPTQDLPGRLSELGVDYGKKLIEDLTGIDPLEKFDQAKSKLDNAVAKWNSLPNTAATELWSLLGDLKEKPDEIRDLREFVRGIAGGDPAELQQLLARSLESVEFFRSPAGRWLQSFAGFGVLSLVSDLPQLQSAAQLTSNVLDGGAVEDVVKRLQGFIEKNLKLDKVLAVASETDAKKLDRLLKLKLAEFLDEKLEALDFEKIQEIQKTIQVLLEKRKTFYDKARKALNRKYEFSFAAAYQKTTTRTALLDIEFDFAQGNGDLTALLQAAVNGDFDTVLIKDAPGVQLHTGTLTHEINRQSYVEVSLPFYKSRVDHINRSLARADAIDEEDGRVVVSLLSG